MNAAIYVVESGEITRRYTGPPAAIDIQCAEGEDFYLNCPSGATHIVNGIPVSNVSIEKLRAQKYAEIKRGFDKQIEQGTQTGFTTSLGWKVYDAEKDLSNYERALNSLRYSNAPSKPIKVKGNPRIVTATVSELETIVKELTMQGERLYAAKWQIESDIEEADTPEELDAITWQNI